MPCLKILTNIPNNKIPKDIVNKIIPVLSKCVRKEEFKFTCVISGDCHVSFGGDAAAPGAAATLESIGHVNPGDNKVIGREISDFLHRELDIHPDRFFMSIYDVPGTNIVKGGITHEAEEEKFRCRHTSLYDNAITVTEWIEERIGVPSKGDKNLRNCRIT